MVVLLALAVMWSAAVVAQEQPPRPERGRPPQLEQAPKQGMRFEMVREGPAETCQNNCREWVAASGPILPDTDRDFEAFARTHDIAGKVMVLESPGGAVVSGLALGRALRRLNMTVVIGHTTLPAADAVGERRATYSPKGLCASMCPFVLLGGARRHVPPESVILVHQIWPGAARADSTAANYSAGQVAGLLRGTAEIARYVVDMGGDIELFDLSMRIPPWESLRRLTQAEVLRTRLSSTDTPFAAPDNGTDASLPPGVLPPFGNQPIPIARWLLLGTGAERGISRGHPLTIRGEDIGTFIVTFTCGETPQTLALRYWETRRLASLSNPDVVSRALVALGGNRVMLKVESSRVAGGRLESIARGSVDMSLLAKASQASNSITMATLTEHKVETTIRVGNTGLGAALPKLTADCPH